MNPSHRTRRRRRREGFTLLEVMLVLGILVVLGSVGIFAYQATRERANIRIANIKVDELKENVNMYREELKHLPPTLEALWDPTQDQQNSLQQIFVDKPIDTDPWGHPYQYEQDGVNFRVWSTGPNPNDDADDISS